MDEISISVFKHSEEIRFILIGIFFILSAISVLMLLKNMLIGMLLPMLILPVIVSFVYLEEMGAESKIHELVKQQSKEVVFQGPSCRITSASLTKKEFNLICGKEKQIFTDVSISQISRVEGKDGGK